MKDNVIKRQYNRLDNHMKAVIHGAGLTLLIKVAGAGFSFGFNVLLARTLGAEGAGVYFLAITLVTISATLGRFGLGTSLLRFIAAHKAKGEWGIVMSVFHKGILLSLVCSTLLSLFLYILTPWLSEQVFNKPALIQPLRIMAIAIVPLSLGGLLAESLKGLERIRDSQLLQGLISPLLVCIGIITVRATWNIAGVASVYLIAVTLTLFCGVWFWHKATSEFHKKTDNLPWHKLLESCVPLLWVQLMQLTMTWTSTFALGIWCSKTDIGIFGAAQRTAMLTSFILISVNSIAAPKFSALYTAGKMRSLRLLAQKSTLLMTIIATPILLIFMLAPQLVMSIFGDRFKEGGYLLSILAFGQFINVITGSVGYLLIMSGNEKLMRNNTLVVGIVAIILNLLLVPAFGPLGAALATAISMSLMNLGAFYLVWKVLGIWTFPIWRREA